MLGCYDFCGHYEWTFAWLEQRGGEALVHQYWDEAIAQDSQTHASDLIGGKGIAGMKEYWGHTLEHEAAGYHCSASDTVFRIDMHECPSKGFLIQNGLAQYKDYCDHCIGWIGPMLGREGWVVDHQHNHNGQCWWEIRARSETEAAKPTASLGGARDVRLRPDWKQELPLDTFAKATSVTQKQPG